MEKRKPVKIGVVSDTHLHRPRPLPEPLANGLKGVDLIVHAGDWIHPDTAGLFEAFAPVVGVAGNNDGPDIVRRFGRRLTLEQAGVRIGVVHGDGGRLTTEERAWEAFKDDPPDVIVFGHSHIPYKGQRGNTLMFNPGSPTDKRFQPRYSFGILVLDEGRIVSAEHVFFDK
ncbi:metallophosphoesterase family protein [Paenibacillus thermoaerophilus]|uniref:Phosphoesterase n=1 Tax=Paenibacillus thermoaerophilus TaxID=1215385 RepID=A0ABW2V3P0_9BACL|nr:metallophosphoesterase [Paenibacillus thermoaerophilus]TMV17157.1 metallophosphoesterase [Paenibacillus thermoaerophilus]